MLHTHSSSYGELLKRITAVDDITYPTVIVLKLNMVGVANHITTLCTYSHIHTQHAVYHLAVSDDFKEELTMFLGRIKDGSAQPTRTNHTHSNIHTYSQFYHTQLDFTQLTHSQINYPPDIGYPSNLPYHFPRLIMLPTIPHKASVRIIRTAT